MLLTLYVALAIGVSFLCSILEAVLLRLTPAYVEVYSQNHPRGGRALTELHGNLDRPLAAILSLSTVAHTVGAAGAGAEAARVFGSAWVGLFSAVLTLAILLLSEVIPKTLGAVYWRQLAPFAAVTLPILVRLLLPLVWLSSWITRLLQPESMRQTSRAEIAALADIGVAEGTIEGHESHLLKHLLRFRDVRVGDVMTPLSVVGSLDATLRIEEDVARKLPFSRIPVYEHDAAVIIGYVLRDELLELVGNDHRVGDLKRGIVRLDVDASLPVALDAFLERREKIAVVTASDGRAVGIATLEDVLETLIGMEIVDEGDPVVDMRALARERANAARARQRSRRDRG